MLPILSLVALVPGLGGLVEHAKAGIIELVLWVVLALAVAVSGAVAYEHVYDRGAASGRAKVSALTLEVGTLKAQVAQAAAAAEESASTAEGLAQQLTDLAVTTNAEGAQAHADADRYTAALHAAETRCGHAEGASTIPDAVHDALTGRAVPSEDAPIPGSLRDAVRALRKGSHR
ncbi:hypothetical protein ASG63_08900 [Methylobacterium sp. Leaf94]|uniref:hypothetical protein n=1 Tax=Methylobacterium sp. Leaf94 TaxID=1736250 RepID=UPI0006F2382C|nr:hypothetical protein [Methylobacterium sp. Leaf94]KQU17614.1 hypothetical protein ASG63_08900 [Methylobacterium sp. Leaf94]